MSGRRDNSPLWIGYRAERARKKADEWTAKANQLEDLFWEEMQKFWPDYDMEWQRLTGQVRERVQPSAEDEGKPSRGAETSGSS